MQNLPVMDCLKPKKYGLQMLRNRIDFRDKKKESPLFTST